MVFLPYQVRRVGDSPGFDFIYFSFPNCLCHSFSNTQMESSRGGGTGLTGTDPQPRSPQWGRAAPQHGDSGETGLSEQQKALKAVGCSGRPPERPRRGIPPGGCVWWWGCPARQEGLTHGGEGSTPAGAAQGGFGGCPLPWSCCQHPRCCPLGSPIPVSTPSPVPVPIPIPIPISIPHPTTTPSPTQPNPTPFPTQSHPQPHPHPNPIPNPILVPNSNPNPNPIPVPKPQPQPLPQPRPVPPHTLEEEVVLLILAPHPAQCRGRTENSGDFRPAPPRGSSPALPLVPQPSLLRSHWLSVLPVTAQVLTWGQVWGESCGVGTGMGQNGVGRNGMGIGIGMGTGIGWG